MKYYPLWVDKLRSEGRLDPTGSRTFKTPYRTWNYKGEVDENGLPCGSGVANSSDGKTYRGTWFNDRKHGVGRQISASEVC